MFPKLIRFLAIESMFLINDDDTNNKKLTKFDKITLLEECLNNSRIVNKN